MTVKLANGSTLGTRKSDVCHRLREVRKAVGKTQTQMAGKLGISNRSYNYYEQGKRTMPLDLATKFIKLHDLEAEWFLFGQEGRIDASEKDAG